MNKIRKFQFLEIFDTICNGLHLTLRVLNGGSKQQFVMKTVNFKDILVECWSWRSLDPDPYWLQKMDPDPYWLSKAGYGSGSVLRPIRIRKTESNSLNNSVLYLNRDTILLFFNGNFLTIGLQKGVILSLKKHNKSQESWRRLTNR